MEWNIATKLDRFLANLLDGIVVNLLCFTIIGIPVALAYMLLKDSFDFLDYQSLGKKVLKIKVVNHNKEHITPGQSFKRNILLWIPLYGMIELLIFLFSHNTGRRIGDKFAETIVIKLEENDTLPKSSDWTKPMTHNQFDNIDDEIRKLAKLKEDGLINEDEFNKRKAKILDIESSNQ